MLLLLNVIFDNNLIPAYAIHMKQDWYVYLHRFRNGTLYVGKGRRNRVTQLFFGRHNTYWDRLLKKYGKPNYRVLKSGLSEKQAENLEKNIIKLCVEKNKKLCNVTRWSPGGRSSHFSVTTRKKISEANQGENNAIYGISRSEGVKDQIRRKQLGKYIGAKSPRYNKTIYDFVNDFTKEQISCTQQDFCIYLNAGHSAVSNLVSSKLKSFRGWRLKETPLTETGKSGLRNGRADKTIYHFIHKDGTSEQCTRFELAQKYSLPNPSNLSSLCKGKIPSYKGWMVES